jgi:formate dehydrogenase subunit delta
MDIEHLIHRANQIAAFFGAYPELQAVDETAAHIRQFWDPRLRQALAQHVMAGGKGLSPLALKAARQLLSQTAPS